MGRIEDSLIPARFYTTLGHYLAVLILVGAKPANVASGFTTPPSEDQKDAANAEVTAAIVFSLFCFALDFAGLGFGFTTFMPTVNAVQILCHFAGGALTSRFIVEEWQYQAFWYIVAICNVPTAVAELWMLFLIFGLKVYEY